MWLELYRSVALRDARAMSSSARRLLSDEIDTPVIQYDYIVTAAILGDIVNSRIGDARTIWDRHSMKAYEGRQLPAHVKLLSSIVLGSDATIDGP
jgi:hypothetical protein